MSPDWANVCVGLFTAVGTILAVYVAMKQKYSKPKLTGTVALQRIDEYLFDKDYREEYFVGNSTELHMYLSNSSSGQALVKNWGYIADDKEKVVISRDAQVVQAYGVLDLQYRKYLDSNFEERIEANNSLSQEIRDIKKSVDEIVEAKTLYVFCELQNHKTITIKVTDKDKESFTRTSKN